MDACARVAVSAMAGGGSGAGMVNLVREPAYHRPVGGVSQRERELGNEVIRGVSGVIPIALNDLAVNRPTLGIGGDHVG